ncbi:redoxin domain-containing protein [Synoicihabitans lomoniglobus]|uniref:thioredoxin-dependent peroxiredoxin n=1 Tax=Synoicihabitans lomoniglobus TaxID=2909285 RepID=A0AAF0A204_9BACT|nr:redoxin domain-containing protein [Opitutaceae bacterium LMO-M01]
MDLSFEIKVVRGTDASPETVRFTDLLTGPTVVSVYMRNNTGSCDKQNDALVADWAEINAAGFNVVGVSRDTGGSHIRYAAKKGIGYPLVSDPEDLFATAADAVIDKKMYGRVFRGPLRSAWVLDASGKILAIIEKVDAKTHGAQVLAAVSAL